MIHGINSDFKNHLVLPLLLAKLDLLGSGDVVERVLFESVATVALPEKRIAVATTDNGTSNMITKGMREGGVGRWPCAAVHMLNRVINNSSV